MGQGMPFRAGSFDGAVSISALQWLCNADKATHNPNKRLYCFFSTLYSCLTRSARAVLQFYPENNEQIEIVMRQATKAGFFGGMVVDFPNSTKAKKFFLVLMTGGPAALPQALGTNEENSNIIYTSKRYFFNFYCIFYNSFFIKSKIILIYFQREHIKKARGKPLKKSRDWIAEKKERRRKQGKLVCADSKYSGRRRSGRL